MPPRYAYWTILIDHKPTAFRARVQEELLPTLQQLRRRNADVVLKWFARGQLWESREAEREAWRRRRPPGGARPEGHDAKASASEGGPPRERQPEKRGRDWRPGGKHRDPRDRFKKRKKLGLSRGSRPWRDRPPRGRDRPGLDSRPDAPPQQDVPSQRREATPVTKPPGPPEQIVTRPKPPERG